MLDCHQPRISAGLLAAFHHDGTPSRIIRKSFRQLVMPVLLGSSCDKELGVKGLEDLEMVTGEGPWDREALLGNRMKSYQKDMR